MINFILIAIFFTLLFFSLLFYLNDDFLDEKITEYPDGRKETTKTLQSLWIIMIVLYIALAVFSIYYNL